MGHEKQTKRRDIHRPSAIVPGDYYFVAFKYYGGSDLGAILASKLEFERLQAHRAQTGGKFSHHEHGGICHICGCGNISYACIFYHEKSNSYIVTGEDCAQKMDMSYGDISAFRKAYADAREAKAGKAKAQAILGDAGFIAAWELYIAEYSDSFKYEEVTIRDIIGKLIRYGSISEKALSYIGKLLAKIVERPALEAKKAEEQAKAADCPSGRVTVDGEVLGTKVQESAFGDVTKMLVRDDSGFKVWVTCINNADKGERIKFVCTIEPSKDDPKFGFGKRPVLYLSPEQKKAAKIAEKVADARMNELLRDNPDYNNPYSDNFGKDIKLAAEGMLL